MPEGRINRMIRETHQLLRNIRVAFTYLDEEMIEKLNVKRILPKLEGAVSVTWPQRKKDIRKTKRMKRERELPYEERLSVLQLPGLKERIERGLKGGGENG